KPALLKRIAERAQLREGPQGIENVLRAIFCAQSDGAGPPLTGRDLARIARLPVPVVTAVRRELERESVVEPGPHIGLTAAALETLGTQWGWHTPEPSASVVCHT